MRAGVYLLVAAGCVLAQTNNYPYILKTFAGSFPLGDGGPATAALLYYPTAAIADAAGNLYILDADNYRIRLVTPDGRIATFAQLNTYGYDMKLAGDGSLYVAGSGSVVKVSPAGATSIFAGTGTYGYGGDGGPATAAQVGTVNGIALDGSGNVYFTDLDFPGSRVRMVTPDGKIQTIAGGGSYGFNGDSQPASNATLNFPHGIAVDSSGHIYVADGYNYRIRKFTVGGAISTVAGNGTSGKPLFGPATSTNIGYISGLYLDSANNLYATDISYDVVLKITAGGNLSRIAGTYAPYGSPADGAAVNVSLVQPPNVSADGSGNVYIPDGTHIVRKLTPDGGLATVAGMIHFGGDNGAAAHAILNQPDGIALDGQGNAFIADASNFRIRKVATGGTISTYAGTGTPGSAASGATAVNAPVPYVNAVTTDANGALYLATAHQVFKITAQGAINAIAGTGASGDAGDGYAATAATFTNLSGIAVDGSGNVFVADDGTNRVRMISASTGLVTAFAGNGSKGSSGDGALAAAATLDLLSPAPLAADPNGNVYIADGGNNKVRMARPGGAITTVVGNGARGSPDGAQAASAPFSAAAGMTFDSAGNLYLSSQDYPFLYRVSGGVISKIAGIINVAPVEGAAALAVGFFGSGLAVDQNGDVYAVDSTDNKVWRLVLNSPAGLAIDGGNNQTTPAGQLLPKLLSVQVTGRGGAGVTGVLVNFTIATGSAQLSAASAVTDANGFANVAVTLGAAQGQVTIAAAVAGTNLPAVQFTETASAPCTVPQPVISAVISAGDFGALKTFAPGSWLEIYGSNLAQNARGWAAADFNGPNAPTSLDGVSVSIDGKPAYVGYISAGLIDVQAPADTATGGVPLVVTTSSCASLPFTVQEAAVVPGFLAPASFNVGGTQYLAALFPDGVTYVGKTNLLAGLPFRPAAPGDTIIAYGIGFGSVTPATPPGVVAAGTSAIPNLTIAFGSTPAVLTYAGLAPGAVGLYQFDIVVPAVANGDYPIVAQVGSTKVAQQVYVTVQK